MPPSSVITLAVDLTSLDANASVVSVVQTSQQTVGVAVLTGPAGKDGVNGLNGTDGTPGLGLPAGGFPGQILLKNSSINYDSDWANFPAALVNQTYVVDTQVQMLALSANVGDVAIRTDLNSNFILKLADASVLAHWQELLGGVGNVSSVNGYTGNVTLTKSDVGLGSADNTADAAKPVSTAQQAALDLKQPLDTDLTTIAGLTAANDDLLQRKAGAWINRTPAQVKTDLSLSSSDVGLSNVPNIDATQRVNHTGTQLASTISDFDTQVRTSRLDQLAAPSALVGMNSQLLTDLADPVSSQDAATKAYADAIASGLILKAPVRVASIANEVIAAPNSAIDGVALTTGDRLLLKDQTTASQNGIYVYNGASAALTRATDADTSAEVKSGLYMIVLEGATNADTAWALTTEGTIMLGTTGLTFTLFSGRASVAWGAISGSLSAQSDLWTQLSAKAALASPVFSGTPTAPTASSGTNTTQLATTAYVEGEIVANATPDATASVKGKLQLAGDLGGSAALPTVKRTARFIVAPYGDTRPADYTCATATSNQTEINAAQLAAAAAGNGRVDLLDGHFVVSGPIIPVNNVTVQGQGMFATRISTSGTGGVLMVDLRTNHDADHPLIGFNMYDLELDGTNLDLNSNVKAIDGTCYQDCNFERLYVHDSKATGIGTDFPTRSRISDNYVVNCGYNNKIAITAASWSASVFTYTTAAPHGYAAAVKGTGLLTASGTIAAGDTVTIDGLVYTFKTTLTGAAYEVFINGSAANALTNLKAAMNLTGTIGTDYGTGTLAHPTVDGSTLTSTTLAVASSLYGAATNAITTTATGTSLSFGSATLSGGVNGSVVVIAGMLPIAYNCSTYTVSTVPSSTTFTVSLGTNSSALNFTTDPGTATAFGSTSDSLIGHNGIGIGVNGSYTESLICQNNVCIGNQNNNYLVEDDGHIAQLNCSYIISNNISISAGSAGYRNTGSLNAQFNNNYDFGSPVGAYVTTATTQYNIAGATWSGGVATFTTALTIPTYNLYTAGTTAVVISGMIPAAWNGYYIVQSVPDATHFTVNIASDPGTVLYNGKSQAVSRPIDGSTVIDNVFVNNLNYGVFVNGRSNGVMIKNNTVKNSYNYGIQMSSSYAQIIGNRVFNCGRIGIRLPVTGAEPFSFADVLDNIVYNNGTRIAGSPGIAVTGVSSTVTPIEPLTDMTIRGNHCFDNQTTKTQAYGLQISGVVSNIAITGNNFAGNLTAPISIPATDTIYLENNIGVNPHGRANLGSAATGTVTFDNTKADYFTVTLAGNITAVMPSSLVEGALMTMVIQQPSGGSCTLTLPANTVTSGTLTLSTSSNAIDTIVWAYRSSNSKWVEVSRSIHDNQPAAPRVSTLSSVSATYTPNVATTDVALIASPGADFTIASPTGSAVDGQKLQIRITSAATGRVPTWGAAFAGQNGVPLPTSALPASSVITFFFQYNATTALHVLYAADYQTSPVTVANGGTGAATLTGLIKGNGTAALSAATAGTDYTTPTGTEALSNKRLTKRVLALAANAATPSINTDNYDVVHITAQTAAITSFTTNLSGTPVDGDRLRISITGTAAVALTWGTSFEASTVALPSTTTSTTRLDIGFFWNTESSKWRCVAAA